MPTGQQPKYFQECVTHQETRGRRKKKKWSLQVCRDTEENVPACTRVCDSVKTSAPQQNICFHQTPHLGPRWPQTPGCTWVTVNTLPVETSYLCRCSGFRLSGRPAETQRQRLIVKRPIKTSSQSLTCLLLLNDQNQIFYTNSSLFIRSNHKEEGTTNEELSLLVDLTNAPIASSCFQATDVLVFDSQE